jgi:hypothetical protein
MIRNLCDPRKAEALFVRFGAGRFGRYRCVAVLSGAALIPIAIVCVKK